MSRLPVIDATRIAALKQTVAGEVLLPGEPGYDESSTILIDKGSPAVVVRPKTAEDVAAAIRFATDNQLALGVRSGGHSNAGFSTNDGGMVVDMRHFDTVEVVDPAKNLVRLGSGLTWGAVAKALQPHGLAISSGDTATVGVGGLLTAGGIGWMLRKYGLAIDALTAIELVTADGKLVRATATENPDLFWAVRGGGGNFGIALHFEIEAHPARQVYFGVAIYSTAELPQVLRGWRDYMRTAPEELTTMLNVIPQLPYFGNQPASAMLMVCYAGDDEAAAKQAVAPLLELGKVLHQDISMKPYGEILGEAHIPPGYRPIANNAFFHEFTDDIIDAIAATEGHIFQVRGLGGAMARVPSDAMAFAHRDAEVLVVAPVFVSENASDADVQAALKPWRAMATKGSGAYVNFFSLRTDDELHAAYPPATFERLAKIKRQYDPDNIFNQNYNIPPAQQ